MPTLNQIKEGSVVMVRGYFGPNETTEGTVTAVLEDVKDGMPGIHFDTADWKGHWAYLDQIESVA